MKGEHDEWNAAIDAAATAAEEQAAAEDIHGDGFYRAERGACLRAAKRIRTLRREEANR